MKRTDDPATIIANLVLNDPPGGPIGQILSEPTGFQLHLLDLYTRRPLLTPRQLEVLTLSANDCDTTMTAQILGLSRSTVRTHRGNILNVIGCHSITAAVAFALRRGLIE